MKTQKEIELRLKVILSDDRLRYPNATVFENAPLALIQHALEVEAVALCWVLCKTFKHPRKAKK